MKVLPHHPSDVEVLDVVRAWARLLAEEDYASAFALTEHDPYYLWTPSLIRDVIAGYGSPCDRRGPRHRVTPIEYASGRDNPRQTITWFDRSGDERSQQARVGYVEFDLPLDGEWSDLTATFEIQRRGGRLVLVLNEIRVL